MHASDPNPNPPSRKALEAMVQESFDAILLMRFAPGQETPEVTFVNPTLLQRTGLPEHLLLGNSPDLLLHPSVRATLFASLLSRMRAGKTTRDTVLGSTAEGAPLWTEVTIRPVGEDHLWIMVARDVTRQVGYQQEALERANQLEQVLNHADTVLRIITPQGNQKYVSPAVERIFGYTPEEFATLTSQQLVHEPDLELLLANLNQGLMDPTTFPEGPVEYRFRCKNGTLKWVSSVAKFVPLGDDPRQGEFHVTTLDITARKLAEAQAAEQLERYRTLLELTYHIETLTDPDELATEVLKFLLPLVGLEYGMYQKLEGHRLVLESIVGHCSPELLEYVQGQLEALTVAQVGALMNSRRPTFLQNPSEFRTHKELARLSPTLAVLPIHDDHSLKGLLMLGSSHSSEIQDSSRRLCIAVSDRMGLAYSRLTDLEKLREAREETLRAMGLVLEYRDYETKGHTDRVVQLSEQLGKKLGLSESDLDDLRLGAYLHDVGKVAIPDQVLLKPGKLDPHEWDFIKQHPSVGFELLHHIPTLNQNVLDVVLHHQERWNGSGYPDRQLATEIPYLARIFAVVDVYDALTSERPYKRAYTREEAIAQLQKEAGTLLDPEVTTAFLQLLEEDQGLA